MIEKGFSMTRSEQIYSLSKEGHKFTEIAKIFDLSPSRIGQIVHKKERIENRIKNPPLNLSEIDALFLSPRAANCLKNAQIETLKDLTSKTPGRLMKTKNFGRKSLIEIQEVLKSKGLHLSEEKSIASFHPCGLPIKMYVASDKVERKLKKRLQTLFKTKKEPFLALRDEGWLTLEQYDDLEIVEGGYYDGCRRYIRAKRD